MKYFYQFNIPKIDTCHGSFSDFFIRSRKPPPSLWQVQLPGSKHWFKLKHRLTIIFANMYFRQQSTIATLVLG
ncbi:hypothetical protein M23134_01862 [Microscilla marina ATCC 23134]|uniref:Uncharacterized protein n=1 Tax=Microscilla marina ATCC 23134 TaxID=313606 RepID=A1ZC31_MICM2|nr:hypothetical protein M23134_01862 [Microscilla marina ATCC 23134]